MTAEDDHPLMLSQNLTAQPEFDLVSIQEKAHFSVSRKSNKIH